ncbi:MAG: hypothetical protein AAGF90_03190 [Pseudomonadota bacterium]
MQAAATPRTPTDLAALEAAGARKAPPAARSGGASLDLIEVDTAAGPLPVWIRVPAEPAPGARPLIALHGISRDAKGLMGRLAAALDADPALAARPVAAPFFGAGAWPVFQRVSRRRRPDLALLGVMDALAAMGVVDPGARFDLFGYSGGAQLAHRFAMVFPNRIGRLHLGAAGWYCLPEEDKAYPYGLGAPERGSPTWPRRKAVSLSDFLRLPIRVYVGEMDVDANDPALRRNDPLDAAQGRTRRDRAAAYVEAVRRAAFARNVAPDVDLTLLPGCGHDFNECADRGGLARLVLS